MSYHVSSLHILHVVVLSSLADESRDKALITCISSCGRSRDEKHETLQWLSCHSLRRDKTRACVFTPLMESVIHRCCCYHIVLFIVLLRWFVYSWRSTAVIGYALRSELCQWTELNFMVTRAAIGSIAERIQQSKYRIIVTVTNHNVNQCQ